MQSRVSAPVRTEYKHGGLSGRNGSARCLILDVEVSEEDLARLKRCSLPASCSGESIALKKLDDVPHFLQYNVYLKSGYTSSLTAFQCLKSIFLWTNETVNIWSHLLAFGLFFVLMLRDLAEPVWLPGEQRSDRLVAAASLLSFQVCMLCSAGYHTFRCHSQRAFKRWLALDQSGICVGIVGCYLPAVHFGFRCHPVGSGLLSWCSALHVELIEDGAPCRRRGVSQSEWFEQPANPHPQHWRQAYMLICCSLCAAVLYFSLRLRTSSKAFRRIVLPMYCCLVGYGVLPTLHWVYLSGGFSSPLVMHFFPKVIALYGIGMLGFGFYVSQFPERCLPGRFDFAGHSHNHWHLCVVLGMLWMRHCWSDLLLFWSLQSEAALCMRPLALSAELH